MFAFCYLFRKLSMIAFCLDTVGINRHEASTILRMARDSLSVFGACLRHNLRIGMSQEFQKVCNFVTLGRHGSFREPAEGRDPG